MQQRPDNEPGQRRRKPGPLPSPELAAQRKKEIVRAAAQVFFRKGYASAGMDDIAAALGCTKGLIYHYFTSKSAIVFSLFCGVQDESRLRFEQLAEASETPREALHCIMQYCAMRILDDEWRCAFVKASELNQALSQTEADIARDKARRSMDVVRKVIEDGINQGQFMPGNPRVLARVSLNAVLQTSQWFQADGAVTRDELAHMITQFVLKGIAGQASRIEGSDGWVRVQHSSHGQGGLLDRGLSL